MSENVENILKNPELHKNNEKLEREINNRSTNPSRGENPKMYLLWRLSLALTIVIMQLNEMLRKYSGRSYKFTKSQEKIGG